MNTADFSRKVRLNAAPVLLLLSILINVSWLQYHLHYQPQTPDHTPIFSLTMIGGALVLVLLDRTAGWWGSWKKTLPNLICLSIPILGFTTIVRQSDASKYLANYLSTPFAAQHLAALFSITALTFVISASIISANSCAIVMAPVAIPALVALGFKPELAAASVLIGTWGGICSFGSAQATLIASSAASSVRKVVFSQLPAAIAGLLVAGSVLCVEALASPLAKLTSTTGSLAASSPLLPAPMASTSSPLLCALLPLSPLILMASKVIFDRAWSAMFNGAKITTPVYMGIGMLLSSVIAVPILGIPFTKAAIQFGEGSLDGFVKIVVVVAAALVFVDSIQKSGVIEVMFQKLCRDNSKLRRISMTLTMFLAAVTGTSDGPVTALTTLVVPRVRNHNLNPLEIGSLIWLGGELGRCLSPFATATQSISSYSVEPYRIIEFSALPIVLAAIVVYGVIRYQNRGPQPMPVSLLV